MIYSVQVEATGDGKYAGRCSDPEVSVLALSSASALERLRAEIRYRIELCPCSSVEDDYVQLRVERG